VIKQLRESELARDLGKASLETLAIILYKGGATRSDIDWIRGVNSTAAIRSLLMRGLVERGEDVSDKRRARYTASVDALAHLGVSRREDLPRYAELTGTLSRAEEAQAVAAESEGVEGAGEATAPATSVPDEAAPAADTETVSS
jgi:segregation and condensation protein B